MLLAKPRGSRKKRDECDDMGNDLIFLLFIRTVQWPIRRRRELLNRTIVVLHFHVVSLKHFPTSLDCWAEHVTFLLCLRPTLGVESAS